MSASRFRERIAVHALHETEFLREPPESLVLVIYCNSDAGKSVNAGHLLSSFVLGGPE
jgi:hypothetical protein